MEQLIHILHLEDDPVDAELIQVRIEEAGVTCRITCVQTRAEFSEALRQGGYDIILADFRLPMYDGMSALRLAQEFCPEVPFIFVSGTMGEDAAIEGLTEGATDYVLKQKLSRLGPAIKRALQEAENWRERQRAEIVKQSGGCITVFSKPGQGTVFRIFLPANETSPNDLGSVDTHTLAQPVIRGGTETILLVEDEEVVRDLVKTMLENIGYTVLEAGYGDEALSQARQHQEAIHLLVTDVVMPHMSGRELAERLSVLRPETKVLFISGYTDDAIVRHGLLPAEVEFLPKPLSPSKLAVKVREVLDG